MSGFPDHVVDAAFGPDALAATHRRAKHQCEPADGDTPCICWDGNPENFEGPQRDCPKHGEKAEQQPRWLAGLIARHGQPTTFQPEPITLGASRFQTWAWVGFGVQVEQTLTTWTVSAHRRGRLAKLAGLERYPTDAEISVVVALAGLDDAPTPVPGSSRRAPEPTDVTIRGVRVCLPDERRCADPDRPVRIEIAGVAYADLNAGEAQQIAAALVAAAGESQASEPAPLMRQPAYDAVYRVIRGCPPRSSDDYGVAAENARVWRAVEAALDAMGIPTGSEPAEPKLATGGTVRPVVGDDAPGRAS